jgi:PAS domain S-box-containing protein
MDAERKAAWARSVDAFLPPPLRAELDTARRGRLLVGVAFSLALLTFLTLVARLVIAGLPAAVVAIVVACIAVFTAAPWILRATGSLRLAGTLVTVGYFVLMMGTALLVGGLAAPVVIAAPALPLLATVLLGARAGLLSGSALLAATGLLALLPAAGVELPPSTLAGRNLLLSRALLFAFAVTVVAVLAADHQRKWTETRDRLRHSEELYRRLFEQSKDLVTLSTPEGRLVDVNHAGVDFYGFPSKEEMLASWDQHRAYLDPEERRTLLERLAADGFVQSYESRHRTARGERILQGTTSTIRDHGGEVELLLSILRDVTDQRLAERERAAVLAALAAKNEELERFVSTVSHDLRSPLVTIDGFLGMLGQDLEAGNAEGVRKDLETLRRTVDKMKLLIRDLLELSRIGREGISRDEVAIGELAREVVELLAGRIAEAGVEVELGPGLPTLTGDRRLLRGVLQNLIDNAVKFTAGRPGGKVQVGVRQDGDRPVLYVADNGPGLAPEHRERVFGIFETLGAEKSGTGIGLASVRRALEVQGGRVWVESGGLGEGCTFCFTVGEGPGGDSPSHTAPGGEAESLGSPTAARPGPCSDAPASRPPARR